MSNIKEYTKRVPTFKAVQWLGNNLQDVEELLSKAKLCCSMEITTTRLRGAGVLLIRNKNTLVKQPVYAAILHDYICVQNAAVYVIPSKEFNLAFTEATQK